MPLSVFFPWYWLSFIILLATFSASCFANYSLNSKSMDSVVFFGGMVANQAAVWLNLRKCRYIQSVLIFGLVVLGIALLFEYQSGTNQTMYHGELRKNWFFSNPNVFGNLMGAGFLLACGLFIAQLKCFRKNYDSLHLWLSIALGAIAILTFINLVKSYSRGALVGTCVGTYYLLTIGMGGSQILSRSPVKSSIVLAFVVLCFWGCCNLEQPFAQRIFSIVNINDFSWTKRLATYEGALQIAGDHPWFGFGWNDLGQNYAQYYQPSNLLDGGAFFTNDFLFLAAAFGIPVTLCFVCFVCAQFGHGAGVLGVSLSGEERSSELVRMPCRAAAGVLLVASWFDGGPNGGLFTIATGATFWILLGLGSSNSAKN